MPDLTQPGQDELPHYDETLDVSGLNCPLPILKTRARLRDLKTGQRLRIIATDPLAPIDFRAYCARAQHQLLHLDQQKEASVFVIEKGEEA